MKISHKGVEYILDIEKAIELGLMQSRKLNSGDVFWNQGCEGFGLLIINVQFQKDQWIILYNRIGPYSDQDFNQGRFLSEQEIWKILDKHKAVFFKNISKDVSNLID